MKNKPDRDARVVPRAGRPGSTHGQKFDRNATPIRRPCQSYYGNYSTNGCQHWAGDMFKQKFPNGSSIGRVGGS
jgi:hypothetical protein